MKRKYTWRPDLPDIRDFLYAPPTALVIPVSVDLHLDLPLEAAPYDQKQLGSCTGNGNGRAAAFAHWKATGQWINLSRLFIYYQERVIEGTVSQDAGASIRDGVKVLNKLGAPVETLWPYTISKFKTKPPVKAYTDAKTRLISSYHRVARTDLCACIAEGFPVVIGFSVYSQFESAQCARDGIVAMPKKGDSFLGGHCVMVDAYDDATEHYSGPNSWGTSWGDNGRFHMPYAYIAARGLSSDFWTLRK